MVARESGRIARHLERRMFPRERKHRRSREGTFQISAGRDGKRDQATVTVSIADLSDIIARRGQDGPNALANEDSAEGGLAGAGGKAIGVDSGAKLQWIFASLAGLLLIGSLAAWFWSRRRPTMPSPVARAPEPADRQVYADWEEPGVLLNVWRPLPWPLHLRPRLRQQASP